MVSRAIAIFTLARLRITNKKFFSGGFNTHAKSVSEISS